MIKKFSDFINEGEEYSDEMAYGQLERVIDYATMIRQRMDSGKSLDSWMYGKVTKAEDYLNSVFDTIDGDDGVVEGGYYKGISKSTADKKKAEMKKQAEMDDDDPDAYKELPGDTKGKKLLKKSQHTKDYDSLYKK